MQIWKLRPTAEQLNNFKNPHMGTFLGIEITEVGDDFITARMPVNAKTHQPYGMLHGGASVVLAESLGSMAGAFCVDMGKQTVVGLEINANHIRSVKEGFVYGTTRPLHLGKSTQVWEIKIVTEDDKLVCISRITLAVKDL